MSSSGSATRPGSSNSSTASPTPRSLVSSGSTRTRPSSRGETGSPGGMGESPVVHNVVTTIGGIGRPLRVTSNQFTDIKKFFEKGCSNNDKTEPSGGEDNSTVQPPARQNYPPTNERASAVSPVGVGSSSRRGNSASSSGTSGNSRLDETGQKEESQSSQSQSDEGDEFIQQPLNEGGAGGVDRTISPQAASDKHYKEDKSPSSGRRFPSHTCVLDGRSVHKELDISKRSWSNWSDGSQRVKTGTPTSTSDSDQDLLQRIDGLLKEKNRVDSELKDVSERNQSLQRELLFQRKSFAMSQDRSNDVIERLISENNHLTKSLGIVEKERDEVTLEAKEIQKQYEENIEKLDQLEKIYREAEQQNQEISDELSTLMRAKDKLKEQKTKLDGEIHEARKTKDSLRATIQKLRDQNSSLEERLGALTREKSLLSKERTLKESTEKDLTIKLDETEKLLAQVESENDRVLESLHKVEREKALLSDQLLTTESTLQSLKGQVEEGKKERDTLNKKLASLAQRERQLKESESHLLKEVECSVNHVLAQYPALKTRLNTSGSQPGKKHTEQPYQLRRMMSLHRAVLVELSRLEKDKDSAQVSVTSLSKILEEKEAQLSEKEKANSQLREEYEALSTESENRYTELQEALQSLEREGERHKEEMNELLQVNEMLEEDIEEVSNSYHAILEEKKATKASLVKQEEEFCVVVGRLLVEKALLSACFILNKERLSAPPTHSLSSSGDDLQSLLLERSLLNESLNTVNTQLEEARDQLEKSQEERQQLLLESDKLKVQLTTEISLLKSQVSGLEKDNALLEIQASSNGSIPPGNSSAFQPVVTAPSIGGRSKAQNELVLELQHKVMLIEGENKRLNDIIHNTSSSLDKGNTQRRQLLEMRKKVYFLESEKRQLTDKVSNLHASLKMMRESKDRLTQDRLKSLQEENTSLQDRIRSMEDMFTRKLMNADATIASTAKDNDVLQHKLSLIPEFLKGAKTFSESLSNLSSLVQSQEEELISLKASLSGASGVLSPAGDIMERVLKCHLEIQEIIPTRSQQDETATPPQRGPSSLTRLGSTNTLPPVFQQLPREYISSLEGASGVVSPVPMRSRSQSQSAGDGGTKGGAYVHQIREKLSSLYADSLSIKDLLKHVHESLGLKQSEISGLQKSFTTFQNELKSSLRVLEETGDSLSLLWQRELPSEQLNSILILKHQVETWQDKVIARDMALKDIDLQMKEDYEAHNRRFSLLKSQVLDLKEEISVGSDKLLARDQYIQDLEERSLNAESELYKLRKENEHTLCILQESLNVPEGFTIQLQSHSGNISELVRLQSEELHHVKGILNEYIYQINQLQARLESTHHENSLLKHQSIEQERRHRLVMEELHTERDYLRTLNFQLIEQQFKVEDIGDLLKKLKRSQEASNEQREMRIMGTELDNAKLLLREKELRISELAHQLDTQKLDALKGHHRTLPTPPTGIGSDVLLSTSHGNYPHIVSASRGFSRPHSASSAESARPPRYTMITDRNHPKVINRSKLPSMLEAGDFLIQLPPSTTNGEGVNVDLEKLNQTTENESYYIGYPVVTDDEGGMALTDDASPKIPQKNRIKRHRRTASTGSDNLKNFLSSGSSASDSRPPPSHSSTLPHSVARQHRPPKRPGSADSMVYSPGVETSGGETVTEGRERTGETNNDLIGRYAKDMQEEIGEMINKHNNTNNSGSGGGDNEEEKMQRTPPLASSTVQQPAATSGGGGKEKAGDKVHSKGEGQSSKPRIWTHLTRQFGGGKASTKDKMKGINKSQENSTNSSITITDPNTATNNGRDKQPGKTLHQQKLFPEDELSATLSRIPSLTSSVGRSDSFASTSTSFSGLGGESSPYSTPSLDSLYIDSFDNILHLPFYKRGPAYTPVVSHHTSSSDEESRPYNSARTLKRSTLVEKGSKTLPHHFQPVPLGGMGIHHRTTSSCDSDQLTSHMTYHTGIPLQRSESISISDMDKDLTDHEGMQEKIQSLTKQLGKVRRSSTGSITICTHSGSSMEDIKGVDQY